MRKVPPKFLAKFLIGALAICLLPGASRDGTRGLSGPFVKTDGTHFTIAGKPYYFVGTNFWYGPELASPGPGGDRARLARELDRLSSLGVNNLRIMAGSEGPDSEPWRIVPALQPKPGIWNDSSWQGLDWLLSEMAKRRMHAVLCLTNFWSWSGGMAQYLAWSGAGAIPYPPPAANGSWDGFQKYVSAFYGNARATQYLDAFIRAIVTRRNTVTGVPYEDDPTIMAWELANEPRGFTHPAEMNAWIDATAKLIKSLDTHHLVTTGSEGDTPGPSATGNDFIQNHSSRAVDYATIHIWVQNWGWYDPKNAQSTYPDAVSNLAAYLKIELGKGSQLGKPVVLEEFGIARDDERYDPSTPVTVRDQFYAQVFEQVYEAAVSGLPMAGVNFWAWAGEGRARTAGGTWQPGDSWLGDPPHEPQGWYSVYDSDSSTLGVISDYAGRLAAIGN